MSDVKTNTPKALQEYFSTPEKKVTLKEYKDFWTALTDEEKDYYRRVDLTTGLLPA